MWKLHGWAEFSPWLQDCKLHLCCLSHVAGAVLHGRVAPLPFPEHLSLVHTRCFSSVGRTGGMQVVSLAPACLRRGKGVTLHELMHAVGFWHEHSRADRDKYISISWNEILTGKSPVPSAAQVSTFQMSSPAISFSKSLVAFRSWKEPVSTLYLHS